jgi:hypothetical protein
MGAGRTNLLQDPIIDMSTFVGQKARSKQAEAEMDPNDTRNRNKMARYGCKAHMHVGKRQGLWTCTVFIEEHTNGAVLRHQLGTPRGRYDEHNSKFPSVMKPRFIEPVRESQTSEGDAC